MLVVCSLALASDIWGSTLYKKNIFTIVSIVNQS